MIKRYCSRLTFWPRGVSLSLSLSFHPSYKRAPRRRYESEFRLGQIRVGFFIFLSFSRSSITFQYVSNASGERFFSRLPRRLFQKRKQKTSAHTFPKARRIDRKKELLFFFFFFVLIKKPIQFFEIGRITPSGKPGKKKLDAIDFLERLRLERLAFQVP